MQTSTGDRVTELERQIEKYSTEFDGLKECLQSMNEEKEAYCWELEEISQKYEQ